MRFPIKESALTLAAATALTYAFALPHASAQEPTPTETPAPQVLSTSDYRTDPITREAITVTPAPSPKPTEAMPAHMIDVPATVGNIEGEDRTVPPCQTEDSTNCYWDAAIRGNHQGTSFINWDGVYYYAQ